MKKTLILTALLLTGCATDPATTKLIVDAQREARNRPTLAVTCPQGGCSVLYHDPRDQAAFKLPTNGWDATISISNNLTGIAQGLVVPAAMGFVATQGFKALQGSGGVINNTTTLGANSGANSGNTTPTTTTTLGANSGANSGNTTPTTTTTTTIGANSGSGSGNSGKLSGTTLTDQTSTPTVVTQPAPVIVTQPAPTVVTQPAPVIVIQPAPVIVPPTIVTQPAPVIVTTPATAP